MKEVEKSHESFHEDDPSVPFHDVESSVFSSHPPLSGYGKNQSHHAVWSVVRIIDALQTKAHYSMQWRMNHNLPMTLILLCIHPIQCSGHNGASSR